MSPSRFFAKTVLPAPMNVIFGMIVHNMYEPAPTNRNPFSWLLTP
jgi:hypothetical protein